MKSFAAGVVITGPEGDVGIATLSDVGGSGTGMLDVWSIPGEDARRRIEEVIVELIASAFGVSDLRALYHERFDRDPWLLGATEPLWRTEVVFPEFASIEGRFESRTQRVLWRSDFESTFHRHVEPPA